MIEQVYREYKQILFENTVNIVFEILFDIMKVLFYTECFFSLFRSQKRRNLQTVSIKPGDRIEKI